MYDKYSGKGNPEIGDLLFSILGVILGYAIIVK